MAIKKRSKKQQDQSSEVDDRLRKMGRRELVEVIYALQQNEAEQAKQLEKLRSQMNERSLVMTEAGSIAEASLALNEVFDRAQQAADQYLSSVRASETEAHEKADEIVADARELASKLVAQANDQANALIEEAQARAQAIEAQAQQRAQAMLAEADQRAHDAYDQAERTLLEANKVLEGIGSLAARPPAQQ